MRNKQVVADHEEQTWRQLKHGAETVSLFLLTATGRAHKPIDKLRVRVIFLPFARITEEEEYV